MNYNKIIFEYTKYFNCLFTINNIINKYEMFYIIIISQFHTSRMPDQAMHTDPDGIDHL